MNKKELRTALKLRRKAMTKADVLKKSTEICRRVINTDIFKASETIMVYLSFSNEADTKDLIENAFLKGKNVIVPVTRGEDIIPCVLKNPDDLKKGAFGIDEPAKINEWTGKIDLCIVPGLGFEMSGARIGFGRGYYDRFLEKTPCKKIGIAYSEQIEENVFSEPHDIPMDMIVTEKEVFYCG